MDTYMKSEPILVLFLSVGSNLVFCVLPPKPRLRQQRAPLFPDTHKAQPHHSDLQATEGRLDGGRRDERLCVPRGRTHGPSGWSLGVHGLCFLKGCLTEEAAPSSPLRTPYQVSLT